MFKLVMTAAAFAVAGFASAAPAAAQVARPDPGISAASAPSITNVQFRRGFHGGWGRGGWGHGGWGGGWGGRGFYGPRYGGYGPGWGYGAAGLGLGLATGAIIGGAIASQPYAYETAPVYGGGDAVAYCMSRFRSYDPASGTYLGYDGFRHPCP